MGKVHPDIVDARRQFSCEEPLLEFLKYRNDVGSGSSAVISWEILGGLFILISLAWGPGLTYIAIIMYTMWALIKYFYRVPRAFHSYFCTGMLTLIFCTPMDNQIIIQNLNKSTFGFSVGNTIWASCQCGIFSVLILYGYLEAEMLILPLSILLFIMWILLIECAIISALCPEWVYKSGLVFGVFLLISIFTGAMAWGIYFSIGHGTQVDLFFAITIQSILMSIIAYLGWRYLPVVAEMRRRGVFDQH
jgi:hypothetical protein